MAYILWKTCRDNYKEKASLRISIPIVLSVVFLSLLLAVSIGYGGMFAIFYDYHKHSAVIQDLVAYKWPVIYSDAKDPSMLTYYIGSYLFPALIGKLFASRIVGEFALGVWGWIGMLLLFVNILFLTNAQSGKAQISALLIYLFFYGLLLPLQYVMRNVNPDLAFTYENPHWFGQLQYRSSIVSLKWVWPQYIVPVLGLTMLYNYHNRRDLYAVWMLPSLLCGTWGFVTLFAYTIMDYIIHSIRKHTFYADIFSWQNIVCAIIGGVFAVYLCGNLQTEKPAELKFQFITDYKYYLLSYLPFCLFMFGFYYMLIWKHIHKDSFFYITLLLLCIIPCFKAGLLNDWVMCTSMPALFFLSVYCIRFMLIQIPRTNVVLLTKKEIIGMMLICSLSYTELEIYNNAYSGMPQRTLRNWSCLHDDARRLDDRTNYFTYNYEESLFYKYIARL